MNLIPVPRPERASPSTGHHEFATRDSKLQLVLIEKNCERERNANLRRKQLDLMVDLLFQIERNFGALLIRKQSGTDRLPTRVPSRAVGNFDRCHDAIQPDKRIVRNSRDVQR
jgi:hypothetical protein